MKFLNCLQINFFKKKNLSYKLFVREFFTAENFFLAHKIFIANISKFNTKIVSLETERRNKMQKYTYEKEI